MRAAGKSVRRRTRRQRALSARSLVATADASLLDLIDRVLNKGVVITGDVMLGVADVDLIYLRLSAIFAAVDRVFPPRPARGKD